MTLNGGVDEGVGPVIDQLSHVVPQSLPGLVNLLQLRADLVHNNAKKAALRLIRMGMSSVYFKSFKTCLVGEDKMK